MGYPIDILVIPILEQKKILVRPQFTELKWEKVQKRNYSLFGPLETARQKVRRIVFMSGEREKTRGEGEKESG